MKFNHWSRCWPFFWVHSRFFYHCVLIYFFINSWKCNIHFVNFFPLISNMFWCRNPNLGSQPRQGLTRMRTKREARETHLLLLGVQKNVREWTITLPNELPFWELESQWIFEFSEGNFRWSKLIKLKPFLYHWKALGT
jgi:hypothetical protein